MVKYVLLFMTLACSSSVKQDSKIIYVAPHLADCTGVGPQKCMLVKEALEDDWTFFYDQIEGFTYEEGYAYELLVEINTINDPPADASSLKYILKELISKELSTEDNSLYQKWKVIKLEGLSKLEETPSIEFIESENKVNGFAGCNNFFGSFALNGNNLSFGPLGMTRKMCPDMSAENYMVGHLDQINSYEFSDGTLILKNKNNDPLIHCVPY